MTFFTARIIPNRSRRSWLSVLTSIFASSRPARTSSTKPSALSSAGLSCTKSQTLSALRSEAGMTTRSISKPMGATWTRRFSLFIVSIVS